MSEQDQKKEIRRMRALLQKMAEMAEHVEQTGSFRSGINNSVTRYNAIVEHLEENDVIPEDLFPELDEDADSGQLGAEATLLADYLADLMQEEDPGQPRNAAKKPDLNMMVALAPFLERNELTNIVRKHFTSMPFMAEEKTPEKTPTATQAPNLQTIIALAPHVDKRTLGEMVRAALANAPVMDPQLLVALAPHMDSQEFSRLIRDQMPVWFGTPASGQTETPAASSAENPSDGSWREALHATEEEKSPQEER